MVWLSDVRSQVCSGGGEELPERKAETAECWRHRDKKD